LTRRSKRWTNGLASEIPCASSFMSLEQSRILPIGFVPRVETSEEQVSFLNSLADTPWVMLDLSRASALVNRGVTARSFYPRGKVVTTSTIRDDTLARFHFDRELEVVRRFRPAWHIPCDRPVYCEDSPCGRTGLIDDSVRSTLAFRDEVVSSGVGVIPLIKGLGPSEWIRSYQPLADAGLAQFAFYVKQYFGGGQGRRLTQMINDVRAVVGTCGMPYLMLVGFQSLARLGDLPPAVRAFAGQAWRHQTRLGKVPVPEARQRYYRLSEERKRAARFRQDVLHDQALETAAGGT
jgi:hypothetical protein